MPAVRGDKGNDNKKDLPGIAGKPHHTAVRNARLLRGREREDSKLQRREKAHRLPQRQQDTVPLLRQRQGCAALSRDGGGRAVRGRGDAAERGEDGEAARLCARGERFSEACLLHLQPRRRGARMGQETVHRQALQGGRGAGGAQLHTVADNGQHGTDGGRPAIHKAA